MRFQRKPNPELRRVLRDNARQLRRASAPAEVKLWSRLRAGQIGGNQFRRQHRIGSFIVDFYCAAHHLVIELDGSSHDDPTQVEKDDLRVQELYWR